MGEFQDIVASKVKRDLEWLNPIYPLEIRLSTMTLKALSLIETLFKGWYLTKNLIL